MYRCLECGFSNNKAGNTRCLKCGTRLNHLYTTTLPDENVAISKTIAEEITAPLHAEPPIIVRQVKCQQCGYRLLNTHKACGKCHTPNAAYIYEKSVPNSLQNLENGDEESATNNAKLINQKDNTMIVDMYEGKKIMLDPNTETHIVMIEGIWHIVAKDNSPILIQVVGKIPITDNQIIMVGDQIYRFKTDS